MLVQAVLHWLLMLALQVLVLKALIVGAVFLKMLATGELSRFNREWEEETQQARLQGRAPDYSKIKEP